MENKYSISLFILVFIAIFSLAKIINYLETKRFHDYNSEMYLRKLSLQIEDLCKQIEPDNENWEYDAIKKRAQESQLIISLLLEQIRLYDTGKLRTGIIASFTPDSWLNYEESKFEHCNKAIISYYALNKHYLKEELELVKETLLNRTTMAPWQKKHAIFKIRCELENIIEKEIAEYIIEKNGYKTPTSLYYHISRYYDDNDKKKLKMILHELLNSFQSLELININKDLIRKTYIENYIEEA